MLLMLLIVAPILMIIGFNAAVSGLICSYTGARFIKTFAISSVVTVACLIMAAGVFITSAFAEEVTTEDTSLEERIENILKEDDEGGATEKTSELLEENSDSDEFAVALNPDRDYLILVNDSFKYEFGGEYDKSLQDDLIYVSDFNGEPTPIEKGTYLAFSMLQQKLRSRGIEIALNSAYRTKEDQQWVLDYYGNIASWADTNKVARPGFSEHHTGLLIDIVIWATDDETGLKHWITETAAYQNNHPEYKIVHDFMAEFGFIDRYPAGKEYITGVPCEPYEIRFVGSSAVAREITENNLCLEEYLSYRE